MNDQQQFWEDAKPCAQEIISRAISHYEPTRIYALFSGGDGSLASTHWYMNNVPGCEVAHIDTGIGIPATQAFVKSTCEREGWPLTIVRAKEDCGQDYDKIVHEHGFPGPASHRYMYIRLKERAIDELVRRSKSRRNDKIMFLTGICHDDSQRRSGYGGAEITKRGAQVWVNAHYWSGQSWTYHYRVKNNIPRSPVAEMLGMSGECLCGAFASPGELTAVRMVCPHTADRIQALERAIYNKHPWSWEGRPPKQRDDTLTPDFFSPLCVNCLKSERPL